MKVKLLEKLMSVGEKETQIPASIIDDILAQIENLEKYLEDNTTLQIFVYKWILCVIYQKLLNVLETDKIEFTEELEKGLSIMCSGNLVKSS